MTAYLNACLVKAEALARKAHAGQVDKAGQPYFLHVETVSQRAGAIVQRWPAASPAFLLKAKIVGFLHDIVEYTDVTLSSLRRYGVPSDCILAIERLTKSKEVSYQDYLARMKQNKLASVVKIADMTHNSDVTRLARVTEEDRIRQQKYCDAIEYLSDFTCERCRRAFPLAEMGEEVKDGKILCRGCQNQDGSFNMLLM